MDPFACLKSFDESSACGDREGIAKYADAMVGWLEKDGFLPWKTHEADWRSGLTRKQLTAYFRDIRRVAEMV